LALTIKSRIPREITADRAVGAGARERERTGRSRRRGQTAADGRESERRVVGLQQYIGRQTDKLQGAGLSAGRER
jgi:hypothetical protein